MAIPNPIANGWIIDSASAALSNFGPSIGNTSNGRPIFAFTANFTSDLPLSFHVHAGAGATDLFASFNPTIFNNSGFNWDAFTITYTDDIAPSAPVAGHPFYA